MFYIMCNRHTNQVKIQLQRTVRMFQYWIVRELWYFSQKTYIYTAKANFYFTGVGKGLHGKSLVVPKAKLVQSQWNSALVTYL